MILFFLITGSHKKIITETESEVKVFTRKDFQEVTSRLESKYSNEKDLEYTKGFAEGVELGAKHGEKEILVK